MDSKKIRKSISRFFGWLGLIFCSLIVKVIPARSLYPVASCFSSLGYAIAGKQRKIALESLTLAFANEKQKQDIDKIARDCFTFMAKAGLEVMFLMDKPQLLTKLVQLESKHNLDKALERGKGVILVSAHFGNFPLMLMRLALAGYKIGAIMRPMRDSRAEMFFMKKRAKMEIKTIYSQPRNACVKNTIEALRNNEIVFIPIDQNFGTGGVYVDFFGRKAATATGPIIFAQRTEAAILPCFIVRQKDDTHKIIFEPALNLEKKESGRQALLVNIQKLTTIIESYIRRYPAEWGWIHRRWKSQPG